LERDQRFPDPRRDDHIDADAAWRRVFDSDGANRAAGGSKGCRVFRSAENPNELLILCEWESHAKAREFISRDDVAKLMEQAGVTDKPDIYFLDEIEKTPS
jgi:heme-degrading monooxygenase HmoA